MSSLVVDGFDFLVDASRSSLVFSNGTFRLNLVGEDSLIAELIEQDDENHPWSWLIQPPFLYVLDVPGQPRPDGDFEHDITDEELNDHDIAFYLMEHYDVLPCKIVKKGNTVSVSGQINGFRKTPVEFRGEFEIG